MKTLRAWPRYRSRQRTRIKNQQHQIIMKRLLNVCAGIVLCTASCAAQPAPKPAALPITPVPSAGAPAPLTPAEALTGQERDVTDQLRRTSDELAKVKLWSVAEPFGAREDLTRTLVLSKDPGDMKNQAETEEDLNVMERILEKAAASRDERNAWAVGIYHHSLFGNSPALRNLYLEGYGAIFFLNVNYSLSPRPAKADEPEAKEDRDAEWEEARREVNDPRSSRSDFALAPEPPMAFGMAGGAPEYDPEKVESLQKNLAQALKNAVHIRKLKSDETVTIVVSGRNAGRDTGPAKPRAGKTVRHGNAAAIPSASHREKLVMRAKKSDIEAFQNDKMSLDEFRKKVTIALS
jgi:hypothetical protein